MIPMQQQDVVQPDMRPELLKDDRNFHENKSYQTNCLRNNIASQHYA